MRISQETFFKENEDFNPRAGYARVHGPASSWDADLVKIIKIIKLSSMDGLHCKVQRPSSATSQAADTGVKCRDGAISAPESGALAALQTMHYGKV